MHQLVIDIEESRYMLLLQFLKTLDYVKIVEITPNQIISTSQKPDEKPTNQLDLLQQRLKQQSKPLFSNIEDPVSWQKQQRDEWS
jgi:hypothetical protein